MYSDKKVVVFSEIGDLKKVLVHTPGEEIKNIAPDKMDELLFSEILVYDCAVKEHKEFISILENEGVEVIQLVDLIVETYDKANDSNKNLFLDKWIDEVEPKIDSNSNKQILKKYLLSFHDTKIMIKKMMSGIFSSELNINSDEELFVNPLPNLYFTRDPFASVGNGVTINRMKYSTRRRETLFSDFIFHCHPEYKNVNKLFSRNQNFTIEGGDIFIYNDKTIVIGVSERTEMQAILEIGKNVKSQGYSFEKIYAVNVPKMKNLMHLDTWLTMIDYNKFIYSPNMLSSLKIWEINLKSNTLETVELNLPLSSFLEKIIGSKPILIPVAGDNARHIDIDIETKFDATNYLVIRPNVVVGYSRNEKTNKALREVGVKVYTFEGNQLSLGMGSARCMSMPLLREKI